jgi:dihydroorotate dehydrogenase electron transfer subunit
MYQVNAPVVSAIEVVPQTYLLRLEAPAITSKAKPGQFVMVSCGEETFLPRPFSIHRVEGGVLAILFHVIGKGTSWLSRCKKGDSLDIFGPLGNGFSIKPGAQNLMLVGGGIGLAPLHFLAEEAVRQGKKVTIIQGARSSDCLLPVSLPQKIFDEGVLPANLQVINCTDDGSEGFKGLVTSLIPHYVNSTHQVFACGPKAMYRTMSTMPELRDKPVQLSLEIMMGCGTGVCYGCTIKTKSGLKQVCKDGPVFELREVDWQI